MYECKDAMNKAYAKFGFKIPYPEMLEEVIGDVKKELPKITADSIEAVCRIFEKQDEKRPTLSSMVTHYISIK